MYEIPSDDPEDMQYKVKVRMTDQSNHPGCWMLVNSVLCS